MRFAGLAVIILVLSGCAQDPSEEGPPLQDRGELPIDIDAPPPSGDEEEITPISVGKGVTLKGRVVDAAGRPIRGAAVWAELVDLRMPFNNLAEYQRGRNATIATTTSNGEFTVRIDEPFYFLVARTDGYMLERIRPELTEQALTIHMDVDSGIRVMAHRGASFYAPENTLASMRKAEWLGAHRIEVDVRLTADGHLVVYHDANLTRLHDDPRRVQDLRLDQMRALDVGVWFHESFAGTRVKTLEEFIWAAQGQGTTLVVDVKAPEELRYATWQAVIDTIKREHVEDLTWFATFRQAGVSMCVQAGLQCALLSRDPLNATIIVDRAYRLGADGLMVDFELVDEAMVSRARQLGMELTAWTLNEEETWSRAYDLGVDSIGTDRPGYLIEWLDKRR